MILPLQYCKLHRNDNESTYELMGWLCIRATECNYKEHDRRPKEQIIYGIDNDEIKQKIIKEFMAQKYTQEMDSERVLIWCGPKEWKWRECRKKH